MLGSGWCFRQTRRLLCRSRLKGKGRQAEVLEQGCSIDTHHFIKFKMKLIKFSTDHVQKYNSISFTMTFYLVQLIKNVTI